MKVWLGGVVVRALDLRLEIAGSIPAAALSSATLDRLFTHIVQHLWSYDLMALYKSVLKTRKADLSRFDLAITHSSAVYVSSPLLNIQQIAYVTSRDNEPLKLQDRIAIMHRLITRYSIIKHSVGMYICLLLHVCLFVWHPVAPTPYGTREACSSTFTNGWAREDTVSK